MKSRHNLVRLKQFQVSEKRRQLAQLDLMIGEFDRMAAELDNQITAEEKKAGITDVNHFAYPTFAKAARQRRDNLRNSQIDLAQQKEAAQTALDEAEQELAKAEMLESRDGRGRDVADEPRQAMHG
ncbi:MAG: flagellar export protein FliJ [Rhizobiaceae bacterium]|jgi:flagellar export protein FliJ|nr:flagellar export protein FliJ [Rhizobiaceae bacterium]MBO6726654.1 flagellar export protein FliJ [Rhizobiaceae bacterium]